jgi:hypothetical protein
MTTAATGPVVRRLARLRVPLGFASAALAFVFARPTPESLLLGLLVALPGELLRIWAAGHIEKGREVTTSGPYRFTRHPLYVGSSILGAGFAVAAGSWVVAAIAAVYLGATLTAAVRTEEAALDARFGGDYARYREGVLPAAARRFSLARVRANREQRTIAGCVVVSLLLLAKAAW